MRDIFGIFWRHVSLDLSAVLIAPIKEVSFRNNYATRSGEGGNMIEKDKLVKIVGAKNVTDRTAELNVYSRDISFVNTLRPDYIVKPRNSGDIKQIVSLANETLTPLVSVSSGAPHFRGDTVPSTGGAVIVDLTGLKKIIRVDRYHRVAMIEAGVTFGELISGRRKRRHPP
jgi:hypothetical protein